MSPPLLSVADLRTTFPADGGRVRAVDGVSFSLEAGETLALVGESGAGKSTLARSLLGLVDDPGETTGSVRLRDPETVARVAERAPDAAGPAVAGTDTDTGAGWVDLLALPPRARRFVRGAGIAMVFQDASTALNPVYTVGEQVREAVSLHRDLDGRAAREETVRLLRAVDLPDPRRRRREYPHQLSGGQRQRVCIAMALACEPAVLVCDEPTTGLDVTIQAQLLDLIDSLQAERDLGVLFVTHDMGVVAEVADRVAVMYAGEVVETGGIEAVFETPAHPYTAGLLDALPARHPPGERLRAIEGTMPTPTGEADACRFAPRCPKAFDACEAVHPDSIPVEADGGADADAAHTAACLLHDDEYAPAETDCHGGDTDA